MADKAKGVEIDPVREKLIELMFVGQVLADAECDKQTECNKCPYNAPNACRVGFIADHFIANGVTVTDNNVGGKWIPVMERLPKEHEYMAETQRGEQYYVRLLIAYMTDTVEYEIGYYDGWKWMTEMPIHIIKNVVAWKPFEPLPEPPKGE